MRLKYSTRCTWTTSQPTSRFEDHSRHPSFPWQEEALSVATHKPNVYIDLSAGRRIFPPILGATSTRSWQDKMLFGRTAGDHAGPLAVEFFQARDP